LRSLDGVAEAFLRSSGAKWAHRQMLGPSEGKSFSKNMAESLSSSPTDPGRISTRVASENETGGYVGFQN